MPKITGTHTTTVEITGDDGIWTVTKDARLQPPDGASLTGLRETGTGNTIRVLGKIDSDWRAIESIGVNTMMEFRESARITGTVYSTGTGAEIANLGRIHAIGGEYAVHGTAAGFRLYNHGEIEGDQAAIQVAPDSVIRNEKNGTISADYAITTTGFPGDAATRIVNHGLIQGGFALDGGSATDYIRNTGKIVGTVLLAGGDDTFDNRGGKYVGNALYGNAGDDTLITDNAKYTLIEIAGGGQDRVQSTVSYTLTDNVELLFLIGKKDIDGTGTALADRLFGNSGDNTLKGLAGDDILDGKGGNDTLKGGTDAERFYFNKDYDKDTLADFEQGVDKVYISGWSKLSEFAEVKSHATNHGQDVWIEVGDDVLVLKGLQKSDLTAEDFFLF